MVISGVFAQQNTITVAENVIFGACEKIARVLLLWCVAKQSLFTRCNLEISKTKQRNKIPIFIDASTVKRTSHLFFERLERDVLFILQRDREAADSTRRRGKQRDVTCILVINGQKRGYKRGGRESETCYERGKRLREKRRHQLLRPKQVTAQVVHVSVRTAEGQKLAFLVHAESRKRFFIDLLEQLY